jgi:ParB family chromosome partitioning protein
LGALIPEAEEDRPKSFLFCGIEEIVPNRSQPRKHFDDARLDDLAQSIREKGILEPLIVRKTGQGYEIVIGERRWRAAQRAGLKEVPVIVREVEGREVLEIMLIENLQRENLNPVEEAEGYRRLIEEFDLNQEDLASRLGKDRSTVANTLRLLKLPASIREELLHGRITAGHARAILSLEGEGQQKELCRLILAKGLSVREAEALCRKLSRQPKKSPLSDREKEVIASQLNAIQDALKRCLGTKVRIVNRGKNGRIEIDYYSNEDLQRIIEAILGGELG